MLTKRLPSVEKLQVAEARQFKGGLNTFDTPLNLSSKYVIELENLYPDTNGRLRLRYGTSLFADLTGSIDEVIGMEYFAASLVCVGKNGKIVRVEADGTVTQIWNTTIAAALPGAPAGWSTGLTHVNFTQFAGHLVICNGVDKPLDCDELFDIQYLQDAGSASNTNVPRARYCTTVGSYLVLARTPDDETTLFIGMKGTLGTFYGDAGVDNDGVNFVTNTYIAHGSPAITGLAAFRGKLIVTFAEAILSVTVGLYDGTDHVPEVDDVIENNGAVSQRSIVPLGDDVLFLDTAGMSSVKRALITATLSPVRESTLIAVDMQQALAQLSFAELEQFVFAVHDRIAQHILFFIPDDDTVVPATTDNLVFVYCYDRSQSFRAWTRFTNMRYRCGARTTEGRIFFGSGTQLFYYHNQFEPLYNDYATSTEQWWEDRTWWGDTTGWLDTTNVTGQPIPFLMSTPWTDFKHTGRMKQSKYLALTMEGDADVTVKMYVDDFPIADMSMDFTMTVDPSGPNQATRPLNNAMSYAWPQKFEKMRITVEGEAENYIALIGIQVQYIVGSVRR